MNTNNEADGPAEAHGSWGSCVDDVTAPSPDARFDRYDELLAWVHAHVVHGTMWVGWSGDGRFAFGDRDHPPADNVTVLDPTADPVQAAALAGSAAQVMVQQSAAQAQQQQQRRLAVPGPNRAARRAAGRRNGSGPGGLILPGR